MADKKISQLTAKGSKIASTDRVPIAQDNGGGTFATKYVTGAEINEVLLDTSPQLGGDLDVNGNKITSASNGNIKIEPNGTGAVLIGGNDTQPSELRFMELLSNGSSYVGFKAPNDIITSRVYTLPTADGTSGQVLSTNGTGTLSWATAGGGITVGTTAVTSGTDGRVFFQAGGVVQQDAAFFWDNTNKRLGIGATPSTSVPLDVRSQGTLSTDVGFRVRNSADTANLFDVQGNGFVNVRTRMLCGFSGMTTTGGALHVYAGNNNDFVARFFGTTGVSFLNIRTAGNGCQMELLDASGTAGVTLNGIYSNAITLADSRNIVFGTGGGTKIASTTTQKFAFWGKTPIVQPTTAVAAATLVGGGGTTITATDTFDGYTLQQIVKALRDTGLLA